MDDEGPAADPLADLMFTLTAVLLTAIALLLASADGGGETDPLYAGAAGLRWGPDAKEFTPLDELRSDPRLRAYLTARAAQARALPLVIAEEGRETAFELEPLLAKAGVAQVAQTRIAGAAQ